jgi:hypothetical protein
MRFSGEGDLGGGAAVGEVLLEGGEVVLFAGGNEDGLVDGDDAERGVGLGTSRSKRKRRVQGGVAWAGDV